MHNSSTSSRHGSEDFVSVQYSNIPFREAVEVWASGELLIVLQVSMDVYPRSSMLRQLACSHGLLLAN